MTFGWVCIFVCSQNAVPVLNGIFNWTVNLVELFKSVSWGFINRMRKIISFVLAKEIAKAGLTHRRISGVDLSLGMQISETRFLMVYYNWLFVLHSFHTQRVWVPQTQICWLIIIYVSDFEIRLRTKSAHQIIYSYWERFPSEKNKGILAHVDIINESNYKENVSLGRLPSGRKWNLLTGSTHISLNKITLIQDGFEKVVITVNVDGLEHATGHWTNVFRCRRSYSTTISQNVTYVSKFLANYCPLASPQWAYP